MNLLTALETDGHRLKKQTAKEYAGACPFCGGRDRFRVWPDTDRFWCRQCERKGDLIQYYRDTRKVDYKSACELAGIEPKSPPGTPRLPKPPPPPPGIEPTEYRKPSVLWKSRALNITARFALNLQSEAGSKAFQYLTCKRGLTPETIDRARLGFNPSDIHDPPEAWNLTGSDPVWIPAGIAIPYQFERIRIRTQNRYVIVKGGTAAPLVLPGNPDAWIITESELDALLISQETSDLATVLALGSATAKPDPDTFHALKTARLVLFNYDYDNAGIKAVKKWMQTFPQVKAWPTPTEKDPGDYHAAGGNIRAWITAGVGSQK